MDAVGRALMSAERERHPAEVDFGAWVSQWLAVRRAKASASGERMPTVEELSAEMVDELARHGRAYRAVLRKDQRSG